jgi:hypothetical protein
MADTQTTGNEAPEVDTSSTTDTADTQTSEASVVNNDAPEATQEQATAQETVAPDTNATDTAEEKLYAGKYKTPEDMEKAYLNAQSKLSETAGEKAELARILNESMSTPKPGQAEEVADPYEEINPQSSEIDQLKRDNAVTKFLYAHGDADATSMQEVLGSDPMVAQIQGHEAKLEYAYLKSQSLSSSKAISEAKKQGAQATQAKIAEKQVASVESARKATPINEDANLMARATSGSPSDAKAARAEIIRRDLINL